MHMMFIDLEKSYNKFRERFHGDAWRLNAFAYNRANKDMYDGSKIHIRTICRDLEYFRVETGLRKHLLFAHFLFALVMDELI